MEVRWDPHKAELNLRKHGVSFEEGASILNDPLYLGREDPGHSEGEQRFRAVGRSSEGRILVLAYTYRQDEVIRIISARAATRRERKLYEES